MAENKRIVLLDEMSLDAEAQARFRELEREAIYWAKQLRLPLEVVHVEDAALYPMGIGFVPQLDQEAKSRADSTKSRAKNIDGVKVKATLKRGLVIPELLRLAQARSSVEFLATGTRGRKGLSRLLLGSVAEEIIRNAKVPVLTWGTAAKAGSASSAPEIIVGTELGKGSLRAEAWALKLAKKTKGKLILVHCLYDGLHPVLQTALASPGSAAKLAGMVKELKRAAEKRMTAKVKAYAKGGLKVESRIDEKSTSASAAMQECLNSQGSVLVLGTHGKNPLTAAFIGSTTRELLQTAKVPVFTVRS